MTTLDFIKFMTGGLLIMNVYIIYLAYLYFKEVKDANISLRKSDKFLISISIICCILLVPLYTFCDNHTIDLHSVFLLELNYLIYLLFVGKILSLSKMLASDYKEDKLKELNKQEQH